MLGAGSIDHRELIYYTVSRSTTFEPPRSGPRPLRRTQFVSGAVLPGVRVRSRGFDVAAVVSAGGVQTHTHSTAIIGGCRLPGATTYNCITAILVVRSQHQHHLHSPMHTNKYKVGSK